MAQTNARKVFEVMEVQRDNDGYCVIYGLTFDTITVGGTLYISSMLESGEQRYQPIEVVRLLIFEDREISEVDIGYYTKIFVIEDIQDLVRETDYLYSI